jgi:hypothetical protein
MRRRTFVLCLAISLLVSLAAHGQEKAPFFRGLSVGVDVFGWIYPIFVSDAYYNNEVSAAVNLQNRFFPVVEVGYGHCNTVGDLYGIHYTTAAPYYRVGMDYNFQYKKHSPVGVIFSGARLGYSNSTYDVEAAPLTDPLTGNEVPFHLSDIPCRALWGEALVGIRSRVWKGFSLGWSLRYKRLFSNCSSVNGNPWFIPGYGVHVTETFGATYQLIWNF